MFDVPSTHSVLAGGATAASPPPPPQADSSKSAHSDVMIDNRLSLAMTLAPLKDVYHQSAIEKVIESGCFKRNVTTCNIIVNANTNYFHKYIANPDFGTGSLIFEMTKNVPKKGKKGGKRCRRSDCTRLDLCRPSHIVPVRL
jgi:hypothetical protein